ncbi:hypothetical protein Gbro_2962 [Gordonia bronchialis DSM 43247]|uniref:CopG domain protein DNA-binding domain protein n=1 Tax=Gordonia bronchialis (strain ATCC 25592 / DSM 43247 / BCRC 13721 / JCM 3198 / KCTC 3076 / NBRC 16047 / NCTC 10667) TaxID=526226 RepID=D0LA05_GORB4|nr:DUF6364 family protein [Gordonia bronchialis]ACY22170.1 hypothetical protein Gbro_2962 [Gordonia bronchialis DSM 43247]MCC3324961.1 DUF6364 family protein [Gordonia bronchialis]QGS24280.1 hypothetical protein FOB84_08975 [Gordonia bronchialis]UAK39522.1 DUF6364 family protein [Gordonia bronchialis]STQ65094.1 Uncharacterised protein [Gordonia bronchialis]
MANRNITLSLPEELVRKAKVIAAERDTSVSALVAELVEHLAGGSEDFDRAWAHEIDRMTHSGMSVGDVTWTRDQLHDR